MEELKILNPKAENLILEVFKKGAQEVFDKEIEKAKISVEKELKLYYLKCSTVFSQWFTVSNNGYGISIEIKLPKDVALD